MESDDTLSLRSFILEKFKDVTLHQTISNASKFYRKMTRYFKNTYGIDWVKKFAKKVEENYKRPLFFFKNLYHLSVYDIPQDVQVLSYFFDVLYGFYFDPSIWEKGRIIKVSIICGFTHTSQISWSLVLNNDDGFYPFCVPHFGIFPTISAAYVYLKLDIDDEYPNYRYMVFGFNLGSCNDNRKILAQHGVYTSEKLTRGGLVCSKNDNNAKDINDTNMLKWNFMDWAANRIKKALREWVAIRKRRRFFQQSVCGEIRALPGIGIDYIERLQKWPRQ